MKDIYIISENQEMYNLFHDVLGRLPIHLSWTRNIDNALDSFAQEKPSLIFMVNEDEHVLTDWVEQYNTTGSQTPFVCFTRPLSWAKMKMIWDKGAVEVIRLPMHRKELEYIVKTIISEREEPDNQRDKIQGKLEDVNLIELIQSFEDGKHTGALQLQNGTQNGRIEFSKGQVVNAVLNDREPMEALEVMATWFTGQYRSVFEDKKFRRIIKMDNQQIIIECLNHINEQQQLLKELPDPITLLFTDPELDYEESSPSSRKVLLMFKDGLTLNEFLEKYTGKSNPVLKKIKNWMDEGILLTRSDYEKKKKKLDKTDESGALKNIVSKVLGKDDDAASPTVASKPVEENVIVTINKKQHQFKDMQLLSKFLTEIGDEL